MVVQIMKNYTSSIAIAGTHGKTTTTSIASQIFLEAGFDPTISIGGIYKSIGSNIRIGSSEYFITEACEYTNSFLHFYPTIGIILNIEEDHLDFFKDIDDIRRSFRRFAELIPPHGTLIINADIPNYEEITNDLSCRVLTFALERHADFTADNIRYDDMGCPIFNLYAQGKNAGEYHLSITGLHNVGNSLACLALASLYDMEHDMLQRAFSACHGPDRRFQHKGLCNGITVIDDYAHHPQEIQATLNTAKHLPHHNIWCVFQPHTYTRTRNFLHEFAEALLTADNIILTDIYAAREQDPGDISSQNLADEINALGKKVYYFHTFEEIESFILKNLVDGDLLITMGAGNVGDIGNHLINL